MSSEPVDRQLDRRLVVVGGAAKSDLWMRIIEDVTGFLVWTIREEVEAAIGAARLAALGCGLVQADDRAWITLVERARPDTVRQSRYDALFGIYVGLYPILADTMHSLADVGNGSVHT